MIRIGCLLSLLILPLATTSADWPQWRGPNRDGVSTETGLLTEWPSGGPKLIWEGKGAGRGYASVAVVDGRLYTLGDNLSTASDKDEYASCFNAEDGKQIWKTKLGPAWNEGSRTWQGSRSTPTVDGDRIYYVTPQGLVVCLKTADGKEVWRKSMQKDFGGGKGDGWGYSESPLIDGERVIVTPGKGTNTMVALNKMDGNKVWSAAAKDDVGAGHSSIMTSEIGGVRVYVQTTASYVMGVRADDGKVLWTYPMNKPRKVTAVIPTPIIRDDLVLAIAGYGKGAALLRQVKDGDGIKVEEVYDYKKEMNNKHGGVVLLGDYVYGDTDSSGVLYCAKLLTGEQQPGWKKRGSGSGSAAITAADGYLYVRYEKGTMALVKATPEGYKESGSFKIPHSGDMPSWAHPVVTNGRLYLREGDHILCYDVKGN